MNSNRRGGSMFGGSDEGGEPSPFGSAPAPSSRGNATSQSMNRAKHPPNGGVPARTVATGSMFGSPSGGGNEADDLFGALPASQRKPAASRSSDLFAAPPPVTATANANSTGTGSKAGGSGKRESDLFSAPAPTEAVPRDPHLPPAAPGVKRRQPSTSPNPNAPGGGSVAASPTIGNPGVTQSAVPHVQGLSISPMAPGSAPVVSPYPGITSDPFSVAPPSAPGADGSGSATAISGAVEETQPGSMSKAGKPAPIVAKKPKEVPPGYQRTPHGIVPIPGYKDPAKLALEEAEERRSKGIGEALQGPAALAAAKKKEEGETGDSSVTGQAEASTSSGPSSIPSKKAVPSRPRQSSAAGRLPQLPKAGPAGRGESAPGPASAGMSTTGPPPSAGITPGGGQLAPVEGMMGNTTPSPGTEDLPDDIFGAPAAGQKAVMMPDASSSLRRPVGRPDSKSDLNSTGNVPSGTDGLADVPLDGQASQAGVTTASIKSPFGAAGGAHRQKPDIARLRKKRHAVTAFGFGGRVITIVPQRKANVDTLMQTPEDLADPFLPGGLLKVYPLLDLLTSEAPHSSDSSQMTVTPTFYSPSGEMSTSSSSSRYSGAGSAAVEKKDNEIAKREARLLRELLTAFKQPLYTHSSSFIPSSAPKAMQLTEIDSTSGTSAIEEAISSFVNGRRADPMCASVALEGMKASLTNEKLLWKLIMIALDCNGTLRSSVGTSDPTSPEARMVRALLDLEAHTPSDVPAFAIARGGADDDVRKIVGEARAIHKKPHGSANSQPHSHGATQSKKKASSSPAGDGADNNPANVEFEEANDEDEKKEEKAVSGVDATETEAVAMIESLLVLGRREHAVSHALAHKQWFLALMISSTCEPALYQSVVATYANQNIVPASTLHSLLLLYSNQGHRGFGLGGDLRADLSLHALPGAAPKDLAANSDVDDLTSFKRGWRRNLAALLSNKSPEWAEVTTKFSQRLYAETNDIFAAHVAMLATGILPGLSGDIKPSTQPSTQVQGSMLPYLLLGSAGGHSRANNAALLDVASLQAMRMTEVIEWALSSGAQGPYGDTTMPQASKGANSNSGGGGFLSSFLGGAKNGGDNGQTADHATASGSDASAAKRKLSLGLEMPPEEVHAHFKLLLCRQKLRLCITLAEVGLVHEAYSYLIEIKNTISFIGARTAVIQEGSAKYGPGANGRNAQRGGPPNSSHPQPPGPGVSMVDRVLDPSFKQSLDVFSDRLSVTMKATRNDKAAAAEFDAALSAGASAGAGGASGKGGLWSALSTFAAPHLKNLVNELDPHAKGRDEQLKQQPQGASPFGAEVALGAPQQPTGMHVTPQDGQAGVSSSQPRKQAADVDDVFGGGDLGNDWAHINHGNGNRGNASSAGHGTGLLAPPSGRSNDDALMNHGQPSDVASVSGGSGSNDMVGELSTVPLEHENTTWIAPPPASAPGGSGLMASDYTATNMHNPHQTQTDAVFAMPSSEPSNTLTGSYDRNQQSQHEPHDHAETVLVGGSGLMAGDYSNGSSAQTDAVFSMPSQNQSSNIDGHEGMHEQQQDTHFPAYTVETSAPVGGSGLLSSDYTRGPVSNAADDGLFGTTASSQGSTTEDSQPMHGADDFAAPPPSEGHPPMPGNPLSQGIPPVDHRGPSPPMPPTMGSRAPQEQTVDYGGESDFGGYDHTQHANRGSPWGGQPVGSQPPPMMQEPAPRGSQWGGQPVGSQPPPMMQEPAPAPAPAPAPNQQKANTQAPSLAPDAGPGGGSAPVAYGSSGVSKSGGGGLMGWLSTKITKTLHPDAHDTSANMGSSLGQDGGGTYYDKAKGRWVFGGDGGAAGGPPVMPPPPTGPTGPTEPTGAGPAGRDPPGGPPGPGTGPGSGGNAPYDPLAAMMAPPPAPTYSAFSQPGPSQAQPAGEDASDPMAMMMAPRGISGPGPAPGGGPPGAGAPASGPPPTMKVWAPPKPQ